MQWKTKKKKRKLRKSIFVILVPFHLVFTHMILLWVNVNSQSLVSQYHSSFGRNWRVLFTKMFAFCLLFFWQFLIRVVRLKALIKYKIISYCSWYFIRFILDIKRNKKTLYYNNHVKIVVYYLLLIKITVKTDLR